MTISPAQTGLHGQMEARHISVGLGLLAVAISLFGGALTTLDQPASAIAFGSVALAAYAAGLLCLIGGGRGAMLGLARWQFGPWILLWCGAAFGLATLTWTHPQTGLTAQIAVSSVLRALWMVASGITAWAVGYVVGPGRVIQRRAAGAVGALSRRFAGTVRGPVAPWILYAIGVTARLVLTVTTGHFGYVGDPSGAVSTASGYQQILNLLSLCAPLAVASAAIRLYSERTRGAGVALAVIFAVELAFGAAAGGKQSFVIAVLAIAIPFSAARRRLPKAALVLLLLAFMIIVIPFNQAYRSVVRGSSTALSPSQGISVAPGILRQTITSQDAITTLPDSVTYLLQRLMEINSPAIILQRTPMQVAYINSIDLVAAPAETLIPRAIWPDKPIMASGYQLSQQYYGLPSTLYSSSAITPIGDLYRYGGFIPVLAGMFFLGCMVRLFDNVLDVRKNPHAIFLIILLFPAFVKFEAGWVALVAGIPGTILVWLFSVRVVFRPRRST